MKARYLFLAPFAAILLIVILYFVGIFIGRIVVIGYVDDIVKYLNGDTETPGSFEEGEFFLELKKNMMLNHAKVKFEQTDDTFFVVSGNVILSMEGETFKVPIKIMYPAPLKARLHLMPGKDVLTEALINRLNFISTNVTQLEQLDMNTMNSRFSILYSAFPFFIEARAVLDVDYRNITSEEMRRMSVHGLNYDNNLQVYAVYRLTMNQKTSFSLDVKNLITYESVIGRLWFNSDQKGISTFIEPGEFDVGVQDYFDIDWVIKEAKLALKGKMVDKRYFDVDYRLQGSFNIDQTQSDNLANLDLSGTLGTIDLDYINKFRSAEVSNTDTPVLDQLIEEELFRNQTIHFTVSDGRLGVGSAMLYGLVLMPNFDYTDDQLIDMMASNVSFDFTLSSQIKNFLSGFYASDIDLDMKYHVESDSDLVLEDIKRAIAEYGMDNKQRGQRNTSDVKGEIKYDRNGLFVNGNEIVGF